jgi:uncharacterized protein (DUF433 family)
MADETRPAEEAAPLASDPAILGGKAHVRGTRLTAEFLQGLLATGWSREAIQEVYPYVPPQALDAALAHRA